MLLYLMFGLQFILMLGLPIGLWIFVKKRWPVTWGLIGAGALTFILSQVVHLPLNWTMGLLGGGRGVALWPRPWVAIIAGLSAGVCEEVARYLVLRYWRTEARSWKEGVTFGLGHGGLEAIIFGALVVVGFINALAMRTLDPEMLNLSNTDLAQLQSQLDAYWATPWYIPLMGGLERVFAITIQTAFAVLVMQTFTRHNMLWLPLAILAHAIVDCAAVWLGELGASIFVLEGVMLFFALCGLGIILVFKQPKGL